MRSVSIRNDGYRIVRVLGVSAGLEVGQALTRNEAVEVLWSVVIDVRTIGINGNAADRVGYNQGSTNVGLVDQYRNVLGAREASEGVAGSRESRESWFSAAASPIGLPLQDSRERSDVSRRVSEGVNANTARGLTALFSIIPSVSALKGNMDNNTILIALLSVLLAAYFARLPNAVSRISYLVSRLVIWAQDKLNQVVNRKGLVGPGVLVGTDQALSVVRPVTKYEIRATSDENKGGLSWSDLTQAVQTLKSSILSTFPRRIASLLQQKTKDHNRLKVYLVLTGENRAYQRNGINQTWEELDGFSESRIQQLVCEAFSDKRIPRYRTSTSALN